jgi:hypothetical protein
MRCAYPPYETGSVVGWIRRAARSQGLGTAVARAASTRGRAVPPKFGIGAQVASLARISGTAPLVASATPAYTAAMRHPIDPKVDCVFKALLGAESNRDLLLELSKFAADAVKTEQERWLKFFTEAERLDADALPAWMQTQEMRRAMNTLKAFSEKEHAYHAYQARQNFLREQQSIQLEFDDLRAEVEQARADAEQERAAKDEALAENERLKRLLADKSGPSDSGTGQ